MPLPRPRLGADVGAESLEALEWLGAVVTTQWQRVLLNNTDHGHHLIMCPSLTSPTVSSAAGMLGLVLSSVTSNLTTFSPSTCGYYQSGLTTAGADAYYRGYDCLQVLLRGQSRGGRGLGHQTHVDAQYVHKSDNIEGVCTHINHIRVSCYL